MPTDEELRSMIAYAVDLGLRVILKPMVNCRDGSWRAWINFFDNEVPCEPKWSRWFDSYMDYMLHYARLAEECGCEMLIIGCELVMAERREAEWRELISKLRTVYFGLLTYNTDKYQEDRVPWWDALDVISSSGYYPMDGGRKILSVSMRSWSSLRNRSFLRSAVSRVVQEAPRPPMTGPLKALWIWRSSGAIMRKCLR